MLVVNVALIATCLVASNALSAEKVAGSLGIKMSSEMKKLVNLNIADFCDYYEYDLETHKVITADDYILKMHRIPPKKSNKTKKTKSKGVVFLQHGLFSSSFDWVITGEDSLAFNLADEGYDVWMGNFRGNDFCQEHEELDANSNEFWEFSFHQMGIYDLPAMINYALKKSGEKQLYYIGHSQGTTAFFIYASTYPKSNKKIKTMYALSPVAYLTNCNSLALKALAASRKFISLASAIFNWKKFNPNEGLLKITKEVFCKGKYGAALCSNVLFSTTGFNVKNLDMKKAPLYLTHSPSNIGVGQLLHYAQFILNDKFNQFSYGPLKNKLVYNQLEAPEYPLEKITTDIVLFHSGNDLLCSELDVAKLADRLENVRHKIIKDPDFTHTDYQFGKNANKMVYSRIIKDIKKS